VWHVKQRHDALFRIIGVSKMKSCIILHSSARETFAFEQTVGALRMQNFGTWAT